MQSVLRCLHQLPHLGEFERWLCAATILPRVQPMLVAPNIRVPLLCVSPAFQDFAHGRDNPPACAVALQDAQRMCQLNIAHAQHVRFANARQCRGLEHAPQTARHVEVPPIRHGHRHVGDTTGPHLRRGVPHLPLRSAAANSARIRPSAAAGVDTARQGGGNFLLLLNHGDNTRLDTGTIPLFRMWPRFKPTGTATGR